MEPIKKLSSVLVSTMQATVIVSSISFVVTISILNQFTQTATIRDKVKNDFPESCQKLFNDEVSTYPFTYNIIETYNAGKLQTRTMKVYDNWHKNGMWYKCEFERV
jgi:hypothetical protein